jgi:hypothetical protein
MIGIGVYGAMIAATAGGAMVSAERALGWTRQLRLTPLRPACAARKLRQLRQVALTAPR